MNQETKSCMGNFQCAKVERTGQVNLISPENVKMIKHVLSMIAPQEEIIYTAILRRLYILPF